jgi:hypothetical protein
MENGISIIITATNKKQRHVIKRAQHLINYNFIRLPLLQVVSESLSETLSVCARSVCLGRTERSLLTWSTAALKAVISSS